MYGSLIPILGACAKKRGGTLMLQFGGTADDKISSICVLSNGDYAIAGTTYSASFCGYDLSASTDGSTYACYFILIIDKALPASGFVKGAHWRSGATRQIGGKWGYPRIAVCTYAGEDHIIFCEGIYVANGTNPVSSDWKRHLLRVSDMTIINTATGYVANASTMYPIGADATNFYIANFQSANHYFYKTALATLVDAASNSANNYTAEMILSGAELWELSWYNTPQYVSKCTISTMAVANTDFDAVFNGNTIALICDVGTNVLLIDFKHGDTTKMVFTLRTKANLANKLAGWTDYELATPAVTTTYAYRQAAVYYDSATGQILYLYATTAGTGTSDLRLLVLNAATGALVRNVAVSYSNGDSIAVAAKIFATNHCEIRKIGEDQYLIGFTTTSSVVPYSGAGGHDVCIGVIGDNGRIKS